MVFKRLPQSQNIVIQKIPTCYALRKPRVISLVSAVISGSKGNGKKISFKKDCKDNKEFSPLMKVTKLIATEQNSERGMR